MKLSQSSEKYQGFTIFWKKCKQTAEISWLFIWDVKISKNFVKQNFSIFYPYVKSYHSLCSPTTQQPRMSYQCPCFVIDRISQWKRVRWQFFDILSALTQFWILCKKIQNKLSSTLEKVEKTTKQVENQQIFLVTLTKKFSMPDYWYKLYKFTQYTWALNSSLFWRI